MLKEENVKMFCMNTAYELKIMMNCFGGAIKLFFSQTVMKETIEASVTRL